MMAGRKGLIDRRKWKEKGKSNEGEKKGERKKREEKNVSRWFGFFEIEFISFLVFQKKISFLHVLSHVFDF